MQEENREFHYSKPYTFSIGRPRYAIGDKVKFCGNKKTITNQKVSAITGSLVAIQLDNDLWLTNDVELTN